MSNRFLIAAGLGIAALALGCASRRTRSLDEDVRTLVEQSREANAALMRGDVDRYRELVRLANDFTLMSPFGGQPSRGDDSKRLEPLRTFFKGGTLEQDLVQTYASEDLIVLAVIERAHVAVGGLPAQDWALRVTLVYRRDGSSWRLVHRHADPLAHAIALDQAAALGRGGR